MHDLSVTHLTRVSKLLLMGTRKEERRRQRSRRNALTSLLGSHCHFEELLDAPPLALPLPLPLTSGHTTGGTFTPAARR